MKIAFIGQKGMPHIQGGVEKHVEEVSTRLAARGHDVIVYTRRSHVTKPRKHFKKVELKTLPTIPTKHLDAIVHTFLACLHVSLRRDVDVIHFHSIGPASLIWLAKLLNPQVPIVTTFHSRCYLHDKWQWAAQKYLQFGEWCACKFSDSVIVISKILHQFVRENFGLHAHYIPNGVGMQKTKSTKALKKWNLEDGEYVLYVGRLVRTKGVHDLIAAFKKTETRKKLVLVGGGAFSDAYVQELQALAKGDARIIFTGQQSATVIQELYSHTALFVLPSEIEGLSIALLEAFACGAPVLASDIIENKDVVLTRGFLFSVGNQEDLHRKLQYLVDHKRQAHKYCDRAQKFIAQEFQWPFIVDQIETLYTKVLLHRENVAHVSVKN